LDSLQFARFASLKISRRGAFAVVPLERNPRYLDAKGANWSE
jgi:hypothetical protein